MYKLLKAHLLIFLVLIIMCCNKSDEDAPRDPVIRFKTDIGYTYNDTTLLFNDSILTGIIAEPGNDVNLTHFNYTVIEGSEETSVDSGMNTAMFDYDKYILKGMEGTEKWTFTVRDKGGASASLSLILNLDTLSAFVFENNN